MQDAGRTGRQGGTRWRRVAATSTALFLALAGSCADTLAPQSLVDGFRVLAVRADVPEVAPGETVTLDTLVADPLGEGRAVARLWVACVLGPARNPETCADPSGSNIIGIGFEPTFSFVAPAPAEGQTEDQVLVTMLACAGGTFSFPTDAGVPSGLPECRGGDAATAYKRVTVATDAERNHNPTLAGLTLDAAAWTGEPLARPVCEAGACLPLELVATLGTGSAESWTEIAFGDSRQRTEEVFVSWFATAGTFERIRSGGETPQVEWTPPAGPAIVDFWFVVHDGRGGTDFTTRRIVLE